MNDPLAFSGAPDAVTQSVTRAGQLLPDKDFSKQQHEEISREAFDCFMTGANDIGMQLETGESSAIPGHREMIERHLANPPQGNRHQGMKLLRAQREQEANIRRMGKFPGYVVGRDYGWPDPTLKGSAHDAMIEAVKENVRKNGIEL